MSLQSNRSFEKENSTSREIARILNVYKTCDVDWYERDKLTRGRRAMHIERNAKIHRIVNTHLDTDITNASILDFGCGFGDQIQWLCDIGATPNKIHGVDLIPARVDRAKNRCPRCNFSCGDIDGLDQSLRFDIIFAMTVFSSILDDRLALYTAGKLRRILKDSGFICWYDIRYPSPMNQNVQAMTITKIKRAFSSCIVNVEPMSLLAPLSRRLGFATDLMYPILSSIPVLCSHYIGTIKPLTPSR